MALITKYPFYVNDIPAVDPAPDFHPTPDADGFIGWITVTSLSSEMTRRMAALSALMAAAHLSFKLDYNGAGATLCAKRPDVKALEVLWNLTNVIDVQAPKIKLSDLVKYPSQDFDQPAEPESDRFDEI